jgi:hypothetical protein
MGDIGVGEKQQFNSSGFGGCHAVVECVEFAGPA